MAKPRLLFISNLFPDSREPYRGLDNATVLHALSARWHIRSLALRPTLPLRWLPREPRVGDAELRAQFVRVPYVPRIGDRVNPALMERALRGSFSAAAAECDVVLSSWMYPDSCVAARLARAAGRPLVSIAQGSDVHQYLRVPVRRTLMQRELPYARAIITRSAELARLLGEAGLPPERLHPIYNGIDFATFRPGDRAAARRALDLPEEAPVVLFVGNFYAIKNPLLLLEAHAQLRADTTLTHTRLVMIGGGPLDETARALAARLGTQRNVIFTGRLDATRVALHMQAADVLALPSENEGVPNVILEAFASGLPVVASRVGGIPEVHRGEGFGALVPVRNLAALSSALRAALLSPPPREAIAAHGRSFTWEKTADAYDALLSDARKSRGSQG